MNVPLLSAIFASSCSWIPDPRNGAFSEDVTLVKRVNTQYTKPIHKRLQATQRSETSNTEQIGISTEVIQLRTGKWTPPEAWEALTKTIPLAHLLHPYSQLGTQLQIPMGPPPIYTCESSRRSRQSRRMSSHRGSRGTASIRGQRDARYCSGGGGGRTPSSSARVTLAGRSPLPHYRLLYTHCRRPRRELPPSRLLAPAPRLRSGAAPSRTSRPSAYSTSITASPVSRVRVCLQVSFRRRTCSSTVIYALLSAVPFSQELVSLNRKGAPVGRCVRVAAWVLVPVLPRCDPVGLLTSDAFNFRWPWDICGTVLRLAKLWRLPDAY